MAVLPRQDFDACRHVRGGTGKVMRWQSCGDSSLESALRWKVCSANQ